MPTNARSLSRYRAIRVLHGACEQRTNAAQSAGKRRLQNTPVGRISKRNYTHAAADGWPGRAGGAKTRAGAAGENTGLLNPMAISQVDKQSFAPLFVTNNSPQKGKYFFVYLCQPSRVCIISHLRNVGWPSQQGDTKSGKYGVAGLRGRVGRFL